MLDEPAIPGKPLGAQHQAVTAHMVDQSGEGRVRVGEPQLLADLGVQRPPLFVLRCGRGKAPRPPLRVEAMAAK